MNNPKNKYVDYIQMNRVLRNNYCTANTNYTHVCMGEPYGRYYFNRNSNKELHDILKNYNGNEGLAEMSQNYSVLRFDIDIKKKIGDDGLVYPLYKKELFLNDIIPKFQKYLRENIKKIGTNKLDCCLMTKEPYKDGDYISNGIHGIFPNLFICKQDFTKFEENFKDLEFFSDSNIKLGKFDCIISNPWLMYGQSKKKGKGTYLADCVLKSDSTVIPAEKYFENYTIYDENEDKINITNVKDMYSRIFSINTHNRETTDFIASSTQSPGLLTPSSYYRSFGPSENKNNIDYGDKDDVKNIVKNYITENMDDCYDVNEWNGNFLSLKRTKSFLCPTTEDRDHDNLDAYVYVNKGKIFLGCYCNEGKGIFIGNSGEVESDQVENNLDLDLDCEEAGMIYQTYKSSSRQSYNGLTYGKICQIDYSFVKWIIKNNVVPHTKYFCKILRLEHDNTIYLEDINPDETINQNDIGSYLPRLDKGDVVCLRSNMMTYKTQNLKELFNDKKKKVLIVSFRVSLEDEYMKIFDQYDFKLYSDFKGMITGDRIIVQIDSLWKVMGDFDLMILDEFTYTLNHLHAFVKKKTEVWDSLNQYIQYTPKIICCDALLDNKTIQLFKNNNRSIYTIDNKWTSFSNKKVNYKKFIDNERTFKYILEQLDEWGSLYIPTNSKTFADKLSCFLETQEIEHKFDSSDDETPTPSDQWVNFKIFGTTPSNVAGVSCNDEFGKLIGYFTSSSCSAEMCSQMMFRVRNIKCNIYDLFIKTSTMGNNYPLSNVDIKRHIKNKDSLLIKSGIKINHIRASIIEDDYFNSYVSYTRKENLSKVMFKPILHGILVAHGLTEIKEPEIKEPISFEDLMKKGEELKIIKVQTTKLYKNKKQQERQDVCDAVDIDKSTFLSIQDKHRKTTNEKNSIRKYILLKNYGNNIDLTEQLIQKLENIIPKYNNLCKMNTNFMGEYIHEALNEYEEKHLDDDNTKRLTDKTKNNYLKIWVCSNILRVLGFDNVCDSKTLEQYPYDKAHSFLLEHDKHMNTLFNTRAVPHGWDNTDINNEDQQKFIRDTLNKYIKSTCHISIKNKFKGKKADLQHYVIGGIELFKKFDIDIDENTRGEEIDKQNNHKRLLPKNNGRSNKLDTQIWEYIRV